VSTHNPTPPLRDPAPELTVTRLLLCCAMVVTLSMGIRHGFGLWLGPITLERAWSRETFSLALAIQNLVWGAAGPLVGWWADRRGAVGVLAAGALLYALGLWGMAQASDPIGFTLSTGVVIGCAQACSTYSVLYGILGRHIDPSQRSWAMGITAAAGSFGQFLMVPLSSALMTALDWQQALWALAVLSLLILPLGWALRGDRRYPGSSTSAPAGTAAPTAPASAGSREPDRAPVATAAALREAFTHPSYLMLTAGYFVCGFQLAFIGVHLPSYLRDQQMAPGVATTALALIGLFNVLGTYTVGWLGQRWSKPYLLSGIYLGRAVAMLAFITLPLSPWSVGVFAATMGALWLSTVPPTNAIVAQMLGVRHLSMLGALVFFSHQIGSFLGVWLAGLLYDHTASYRVVWWLAIALSVLAAVINLPIREHEAPRARRLVST